jgi:GT2 family glycosyltransferase
MRSCSKRSAAPRLAVAIPTIVADRLLERCLESIRRQESIEADVLLIQNGDRVGEVCQRWAAEGATLLQPGRNIGVAASWNHACRWAWARQHEAVVLLNDDVRLVDPLALAAFRGAVADDAGTIYFAVGHGFSAAGLSRRVWETVGPFDEGFWPAYYEDDDFLRRADLLGVGWRDLPVACQHERSAAIRLDPDVNALNSVAFPLNQRRYVAKWGGLPHRERYAVAWDGGAAWPNVLDMLAPSLGEPARAWG